MATYDAHHDGNDYWTVYERGVDGPEYSVGPPNKDGLRYIVNRATNRAPGYPCGQKVLAAVERKSEEMGGDRDWSAAHQNV